MFFFHIQPVVVNVTMSVRFPSEIVKQIIYFIVWTGFFPYSTSSCKRDYECEFPLENYETNNLFLRLKWVFFLHSTCSCKRDYECEFPLEDCETNNWFYCLNCVFWHSACSCKRDYECEFPREDYESNDIMPKLFFRSLY